MIYEILTGVFAFTTAASFAGFMAHRVESSHLRDQLKWREELDERERNRSEVKEIVKAELRAQKLISELEVNRD